MARTDIVDSTVRSAFAAIAGGTAASIAREKLGEAVEKSIADLPADRVNNPERVFDVVIAMMIVVPQALRTPLMHAVAAAIRTDATGKIPEVVKHMVPAILESTDTGLVRLAEEARIDKSALRGKLMDLFRAAHPADGSTGAHAGAATGGTVGAAGTLTRDGGRQVHLTGNTRCDLAKSAGTATGGWAAHGSVYEMLTVDGNRRCPVCFPETVVVTTITPPPAPAAPKPAATVLGVLADDADGNRARSLASLERIIELRKGEVITRPLGVWRFMLLFRKGSTASPELLKLLPKVSEGEYVQLLADATVLEAARRRTLDRDSWTTPEQVSHTRVRTFVDRFGPFTAQVRLIADKEVNDFREGAAAAMDAIDAWITDAERARILQFIENQDYAGFAAALKGHATSAWTKVKGWWDWAVWAFKWLAIVNGLCLLIGGGIYVICFLLMTLVPALAGKVLLFVMILAFGLIFAGRILLTLFDKAWDLIAGTWHAIRKGLRRNWAQKLVEKGFEKMGIAPEALPELPPRQATTWWMQTGTVFTITGLVGLILCIVQAWMPTHIGGLLIIAICAILAVAAEMMKKWGVLLTFDEKAEMFRKSLRYVMWPATLGIALLIPLAICTNVIGSIIGWDTIGQLTDWSRSASYQEACEQNYNCPPEHYPDFSWDEYCGKYPTADACQIRARRAAGVQIR